MAITYTPLFTHDDWIDNVDRVQAGGPNGFNIRFNGVAEEFGKLSTVVASIGTAIDNAQSVRFVNSQTTQTLAASAASIEFIVESYDRALMPGNVEKVYFAVILPVSVSTNIRHTFLYRNAPANRMAVTVQFFNGDAVPSQFSFRIMSLSS